ncbi:MAG TPA: cytochrome b/b6 domain-containing protein, partial [Sphingomonadaceae bacterium]|nr:cytochrome b/b6 domain-containing protein [Sphingomonadaceae bacterium]
MPSVRPARVPRTYGLVAASLHWTIAAALLANLAIGWWMTASLADPAKAAAAFRAFQGHKSLGLTILVLSLVRLGWRLTHRAPPPPPGMPRWQRAAAAAVHVLLYGAMIALPLSGWAYVSAGWNVGLDQPFAVPTLWFGLFHWPHIEWIAALDDAARRSAAFRALATHQTLVWAMVALLAAHVAAALKHQFVDRDGLLARMAPLPK